ncbi:desulfoferrodoxin [Thermostilla marina]
MAEVRQVYVCPVCGNEVEVLRAGAGTLTCCNQPMQLQAENTTDAAQEKHVPVIKREGGKVIVTVGSVEHPMGADHLIEWIELIYGNQVLRADLSPDSPPQATFDCPGEKVTARAYCNLHGLWKAEG